MKHVVQNCGTVDVIGKIWQPSQGSCAYSYTLNHVQVKEIGTPTRASVRRWLNANAGDFREIHDFRAVIEVEDQTIEIPWDSEESEETFRSCH